MNWGKIIENLRWWFLPHKRFYSYYVPNSSEIEFNGHWQRVESFNDVPDHLKKVKGAWRRHTR